MIPRRVPKSHTYHGIFHSIRVDHQRFDIFSKCRISFFGLKHVFLSSQIEGQYYEEKK